MSSACNKSAVVVLGRARPDETPAGDERAAAARHCVGGGRIDGVADPRSLTSVVLVIGTSADAGTDAVTRALVAVVRERGSSVTTVTTGPGSGPAAAVVKQVSAAAAETEVVLVDGSGGLLAWLDSHGSTLADAGTGLRYKGVGCGVVLATGVGPGALNAAALTVEALGTRSLPLLGAVVGAWPDDADAAAEQVALDLPKVTGVPLWGRLPRGAEQLPAGDFDAAVPTWLGLDD